MGSALDEAGDIGEFYGGADDLGWVHDFRERLEPAILHFHDSGVRLDGAEGVVLRRRLLFFRERVEERAFPDVGKTYNTYGKTHFVYLSKNGCVLYHNSTARKNQRAHNTQLLNFSNFQLLCVAGWGIWYNTRLF